MKKSIIFFAVIISVMFIIVPTNACEQSCRTGISLAFGDNYAKEVKKLFQVFKSNLKDSLFNGFDKQVSSSARSSCFKAISKGVDKFEREFTSCFAEIIEDSIFNQTPQFKGQCQHPLRVIQPPSGVAWTMEDCRKQDYICGNPPAICHYMDQYVKPRNVKNVKESLADRLKTNGSFFHSLVKSVTASGIKSTIKTTDVSSFTNTVEKNISNEFGNFISYFDEKFCEGTSCDKYDHDIKIKLLSYP